MRRLAIAALSVIAVAGVTADQQSAGARPLPGANGPRVEYVNKPPQLLEIVDVFVYARPEQAAYNVPRPNRFESGVEKLTLDIRVKELKRLGTVIRYEVLTNDGSLEMSDGILSFAQLAREGVASLDLDLRPKNGPFKDGPYQLRLFMNETLVAILNWAVGD